MIAVISMIAPTDLIYSTHAFIPNKRSQVHIRYNEASGAQWGWYPRNSFQHILDNHALSDGPTSPHTHSSMLAKSSMELLHYIQEVRVWERNVSQSQEDRTRTDSPSGWLQLNCGFWLYRERSFSLQTRFLVVKFKTSEARRTESVPTAAGTSVLVLVRLKQDECCDVT